MRVTLKRSTHQISANGTDFTHISVIGADFQCVYFPQWFADVPDTGNEARMTAVGR